MAEKYWLNLQEQVGKNKQDIADLKRVNYQLATVGIKVVGQEVYPENLPDPTTYGGDLGDAYMVGAEAPFDMYIYTRPAAGQTDNRWFDIGAFPLAGPEGPQGETGATGPAGSAAIWRTGGTNPSIVDTDKAGDMYLNTTTGMVYRFDGTNWIAQGTIVGPRGAQGPEGPQGPRGPQGDTGPRGVQGPVGESFQVIGVVSTVGSLPDAETVSRNAAYIVDDGVDKDLYIVVLDEDNEPVWYNAGPFLGIAAGFASPTASAVALPANTPPTATVTATGPDNAKVFSFTFGIPVAYDLENTDATAPSTTLGYTQNVIAKRTYKRVFKSLAEIYGNNAPASAYLNDIMAAMSDLAPCKAILVNSTGNRLVLDAPESAEVEITIGNSTYNFNNVKCCAGGNYYLLTGFDYDEQLDQPVAHWDRVVTEETLPSTGGGYMPNLLINPDFKINQRRYTASAINANARYTVDRWMVNGLNAPITLTPLSNGGVTVANGHSTYTGSISQFIEKPRALYGKNITLSAFVNGKIISITGQAPATDPESVFTIASMDNFDEHVKLKIYNRANAAIIEVYIEVEASNTVTIDWVKLELGSSATPFSPPDPAEELQRCQYYYQRIDNKMPQSTYPEFGIYIAGNTQTTGIAHIITNTPMRAAPTVTLSGVYIFKDSNNYTSTLTTYSVKSYIQTILSLNITLASGINMAQGEFARLVGNLGVNTTYIALSAEIV